jgi:ribulose-phosphate 3-epimerase
MIIAPSILNAPFDHLRHALTQLEDASLLHLDIMDGHFVPNLSFGLHICQEIKKLTTVALDIHFMTTHTLQWIEQFKELSPKYMTVHVEARDVSKAIEMIHSYGIKAGIAIKPQTPLDVLIPYLKDIQLVTVMTVEPGFGGQSFMHEMLNKIETLKSYQNKYAFDIQVDGGINDHTLPLVSKAGANIAVVGSHLFKQPDMKAWLDLQ